MAAQTSTKLMVLALVMEEPGSGRQVERRLNERLASTQLADSTARVALKRAVDEGLAFRVGGKYEVTPEGIQHVEKWLLSSSVLPPIRDDLVARVALCQPKDMPRLIEVLREAERASLSVLEALNRQSRKEPKPASQGWKNHIDMTVITVDAGYWDARISWLADLRKGLQGAWDAYQEEQRGHLGHPAGA